MDGPAIDRRLTTIYCADVAGYSRLMDADEEGTLGRLREARKLMRGFIERHRGRVANTAGDGLLAEFPSATEAVQCAMEVQREMAGRNDLLPSEKRMDFRIGLNVGDVMVEDGDLFVEGVNVAARLQTMAEAGGILISGPVYDLVSHKMDVSYRFLGERTFKNIDDEIPVYSVVLGPSTTKFRLDQARRRKRKPLIKTVKQKSPGLVRPFLVPMALVLLAAITGTEGLIYPALAVGWFVAAREARKRVDNRRHHFGIQCLIFIAFLFGINMASDPTNLWFLYPGVVFGTLAWLSFLDFWHGPTKRTE
ncbi:MAG: adenylate/guanylate cyclase domain-containing protein [Geminicoccaceae bacterium]